MGHHRKDGICPSCGKRPKTRYGYCNECRNRMRVARQRARRAARSQLGDGASRRDVLLEGGSAVDIHLPPEACDAVIARGWDPDRIATLALALALIDTDREEQPDGKFKRCLVYGDRKVYY